MFVLWIGCGVLGLSVLWLVVAFNALVRGRNLVREGWSGIDVQLKRRHDLIPNLVETVRGYAVHEKAVLDRVTELRNRGVAAQGAAQSARAEGGLTQALGRLIAVAEAYPELKADAGFRQLSEQLGAIEDEVQLARRYYNGAVRQMNIRVESFPSNIVARLFGFMVSEYFEIYDDAERQVPQVHLD